MTLARARRSSDQARSVPRWGRGAGAAASSAIVLILGQATLACSSNGMLGNTSDSSSAAGGGDQGGSAVASGGGGGAPSACGVTLEQVPLLKRVKVTSVPANVTFTRDDWPTGRPIVMAPLPDGGSLVSWAVWPWNDSNGKPLPPGSLAEEGIYMAHLGPDDKRIGEDLKLTDYQEVDAIDVTPDGAALVVAKDDPTIASGDFCTKLICGTVDVLGIRTGETKPTFTTLLSNTLKVDAEGSNFVWWYAHHQRVKYGRGDAKNPALDPSGYLAVYGESAGMGGGGIHQGERGDWLVAKGGARLPDLHFGAGGHSPDLRMQYHAKAGKWLTMNKNEEAFHFSIVDPTGAHKETSISMQGRFSDHAQVGGIVPDDTGFWANYSIPEAVGDYKIPCDVKLVHITLDGVIDKQVDLAAVPGVGEARPYLAAYGDKAMLAFWYLGNPFLDMAHAKPLLAVLDKETGKPVAPPSDLTEASLPVGVVQAYQDFVTFPNGDVGWAWRWGDDKSIKLVRVLACPQ